MKRKPIVIALAAALAASAIGCTDDVGPSATRMITLTAHVAVTSKQPIEGTVFPEGRRIVLSAAHAVGPVKTDYFTDVVFSRTSSYWTAAAPKYWPSGGTMDFLGFSSAGSGALTHTGGLTAASLTYVMPDNSAVQDDILVGYAGGRSCAEHAAVPLVMRHALAQMRFTAHSDISDEAANLGITLRGITLRKARHSGTVTASAVGSDGVSFSWSGVGDGDLRDIAVDAPSGGLFLTTAAAAVGASGVLVPPQTPSGVEGGADLLIEYTMHGGYDSEGGAVDADLEQVFRLPAVAMEPGVKYVYDLTFTGGDVFVSVSMTDWEEVTVPVPFGGGYVLSVDRSAIEYGYDGAYSAQEFSVTSYAVEGMSARPAAWKTQVWDEGGEAWLDLSDVTTDPRFAWLATLPSSSDDVAEEATGRKKTFRRAVVAQEVTSHEERLRAGKVYAEDGVTVVDNGSAATAVDLSKYDFVTRKMEAGRYTANTYVISAPGYYKIPLVYGNAVENDAHVEDSYEGSVGMGHLNHFICPLHGGTESAIHLVTTKPWLTAQRSRGARIHWEKWTRWDESAGLAVTEGRKWSDAAGTAVIDNLTIETGGGDERYLVFHVDENNIRPGNAILAAMSNADGAGNVCWSWQIWITDQAMTTCPIEYGVTDYRALPVNLGWIDTGKGQWYAPREVRVRFVSTEEAGVASETMTVRQLETETVSLKGWNPYYQWGRKDPMSDGVTTVYENDGMVHESIKHPGNIMYDRGSFFTERYYDWTINNYNNLWDSKNNAYDSPSASLPQHKTVYDPSPRRFCVPPDFTWEAFAVYGYESATEDGVFYYTNVGRTRTTYVPAAGYMDYLTAATVRGGGVMNGYWTFHPGKNVQRRESFCLRFTVSGGSVTTQTRVYDGMDRAYALSVRPVYYE